MNIQLLLGLITVIIITIFVCKYWKPNLHKNTLLEIKSNELTIDEKLTDIRWKLYPNIETGTIVKLQSGGPAMTVEDVFRFANDCDNYDPWYAQCVYFDGKNLIKNDIKLSSLKKVPLVAFE